MLRGLHYKTFYVDFHGKAGTQTDRQDTTLVERKTLCAVSSIPATAAAATATVVVVTWRSSTP